jgi:S-formylglutathione hydrolase FrmB
MPDPAEYAKGNILPLLESQVKEGRYIGPALYFDIGADDFLKQSNVDLEQFLLVKGNIPYQFSEFKGAHTWAYWDEHIRDVLQFVMRHVSVPE